jgi:serine phosphatase RsbU (regulator of sigma subunit)
MLSAFKKPFAFLEDRAKVFEETAVFYRPRDGVSGDFYWFHSVGRVRMFSAIDCTGHGVPGAFMSLIGHNALERVTKVYTQPDRVLGAVESRGM